MNLSWTDVTHHINVLSQCFFSYEDCTSAIAVCQFVLSFVIDLNSVSITLSADFVAIVQGSG